MRIGWLRDFTLAERPGGAQVCESLLRTAAPPDVSLVECPPGSVQEDVDAYIALRCQLYSLEELRLAVSKPCLHYAMDYWELGGEPRRTVMDGAKKVLWCSPLHGDVMDRRYAIRPKGAEALPCPMDVSRWLALRERSNGRNGTMWYGEAHPYKGPDIAIEWAKRNEVQLDVYGIGLTASQAGRFVRIIGFVDDEQRDLALASHAQFVHFPRQPEPFCYSLLEAWLAGLEIAYSGRIGWESYEMPITDIVEACQRAPERFWQIAESVL